MIKTLLSLPLVCALLWSVPAASQSASNGLQLPELGDGSSAVFGGDQEHKLGRLWLKVFRGQVRTVSDPLLQSYLEDLLFTLARHSDLKDRRLELVVVDNPNLNAFAVPGGVIGVHNGLFTYADNEAQLAGVLGHELAHLSQRHFARSLERQRETSLPALAGLLAGVVLAATAGGDAGMAAVAAGQAASMQNQLRFSRENELEADRIGMRTLANAGMDPTAIPAMFENMHQRYRYSQHRPPEFLMTHPLTENRINDSRSRARQYPRQVYTDNLNFQLMKRRVAVQLAQNPNELLRQWQAEGQRQGSEATRYGIALVLARLGRWDDAEEQLKPLLQGDPQRIAYVVSTAEIHIGKNEYKEAVELLRDNLALSPENHPLTMTLTKALHHQGRAHEAEELLMAHSRRRPNDPDVWYQMAEIHGLAGNILGVHTARAEYFLLNGMLDRAEQHLRYAWPMATDNNIAQSRIQERIKDVQSLREGFKRF